MKGDLVKLMILLLFSENSMPEETGRPPRMRRMNESSCALCRFVGMAISPS